MKNSFCTLALAFLAASISQAQDLGTRQYPASRVILQSGDTLVGPLVHFIEQDVIQVIPEKRLPMMLSASVVQSFVTNTALTPTAASVTDVQQRYNDSRNGAVYSVVQPITVISETRPSQTIEYDATRRHQFISLPWTANIINGQNEAFGFFELLTIGKVTVVQRESSKVTNVGNYRTFGYEPPVGINSASAAQLRLEKENPASYMYREVQAREKVVTASVKLVRTLYLINEKGEIQRIIGSGEKQVLMYFPNQATKLRQYRREQNLSWVKSDDLVKLVAYGNSLQ